MVFSIILLVYLPILSKVVLPNLDKGSIEPLSWVGRPSFKAILNLINLFGGKIFQMDRFIATPTRIDTAIFSTALFILFCLGLISLYKKGEKGAADAKTSGLLLSTWFLIPFIIPLIFSYSFTPVFGPVRYLLFTTIPYYILIAKGIMSLKKNLRILSLVMVIIVPFVCLYGYYQNQKSTRWKEVCGYIKKNIKNDEKVAFVMNNFRPVSFVEHIMLLRYSVPSIIGIKNDNPPIEMTKRELARYIKEINLIEGYAIEELKYYGVWLITYIPSHPEVIERLKDKYKLIEKKEVDGVSIYHFQIKGDKPDSLSN